MRRTSTRLARAGFLLASLLLVPLLAVRPALAQEGIAITAEQSLGFGQVVATGSSGTVTIAPDGQRSALGGAFTGGGSGVSASAFTVTGEANRIYHITLPSSVTLSSGGSSMTVTVFTRTPSGTGNLGPLGSQVVNVGATLEVGPAQAGGTYTGSFAVTVDYE